MKKVLSVILALSFIVSVFSVCAQAISETKYPVILLAGDGAAIYDADENEVRPYKFSGESEDGSNITDAVKNIMLPLLTEGLLQDKWDNYYDAVEKEILDLTGGAMLDKNGEVTNGSHIGKWYSNATKNCIKKDVKNYEIGSYQFWYDWRTDPWTMADELNTFIDAVLKVTGKDKVCLVGRCLGSSFVCAYLAKYGTDKIYGIGFDGATVMGNKYISDAFCGKIILDGEALQRYIFDKTDVSEIVTASLDLLVKSGFIDAFGSTVYTALYNKLSTELVQRLTVATVATFPGYWSMVLPEDFEAAKTAVFGEEGSERRTEYAGLIEKIDNYQEKVRANVPQLLKDFAANGGKVCIIAKYGIQGVPVMTCVNLPSDDDVTLDTASFGATTVDDIRDRFDGAYLEKQDAAGLSKYISADKQVDSSTCLFPDYTWFTKGIDHANWTSPENDLLMTVITADTQLTADDNVAGWSRYMMKTADGSFTAMTEENCYDGEYSTSKEVKSLNFLEKFIAAIKSFISWVKLIFAFISEK